MKLVVEKAKESRPNSPANFIGSENFNKPDLLSDIFQISSMFLHIILECEEQKF